MKAKRIVGLLLCLLLPALATGDAPQPASTPGSLDAPPAVLAKGVDDPEADVPEGLSGGDWAGIREAYEAGRHAFHAVDGGHMARNPGQQWQMAFDGRGFLARPDGGGWEWGLELSGYGFAGHERRLDPEARARVVIDGQRLSYAWDAVVREWYVNDQRGLEHGYTILSRPAGGGDGPLRFDLAVRGGLLGEVTGDGGGVRFLNDANGATVKYSGLKVWDADGRELPAAFEIIDQGLRLTVEEAGARYPLTIDPVAQQAYLKASNTDWLDYFGYSVSVSGDTVAVGAPYEDSDATGVNGNEADSISGTNYGAAYVFVRSGTAWSQQAYLKASNTDSGDYFGWSVSVSGDTVVVGALLEDSDATGVNGPDEWHNNASGSGAAYVFVRSGTAWSQQAYLKASNTDSVDYFGVSVSVSGDTVVVGADGEDSIATGVNGNEANNSREVSGAAYVFVRSGTAWSQQAYLKASNTDSGDHFGISVAVSGDTVVVGANGEDSNATGVNGNEADEYDMSSQEDGSGAAYVFVRSGTAWSQQAYLKASNTERRDSFGYSVSVSGNTVVVGANGEDSNATGVNGTQADNSSINSGAAYVFVRSGTAWSQQAYLKASNTEPDDNFGNTRTDDNFGYSVSVSGDTVVVGAYFEASNATGVNGNEADNSADRSGAAYVFVRSGTAWSQQAYLKASNTDAYDNFGYSVSVSGDTVAVGAPYEDSDATGVNGNEADHIWGTNYGAAYVFAGLGPAPPVVTWHPQSLTKDPGDSASLTVVASGRPTPTYQWRKDGGNITGATGAAYTIASAQESHEGSYDCVATNSAGAATSNAATLTVNDPPFVTGHPQPLTKDPGDSASFTVVASGSPTPTYQWRKDGGNITGATGATYAIAAVHDSDEGSYDCVVTNSAGTATSNAATLTVNDLRAAPQNVTARPLAAFGKIVLKWDAVAGATGYKIYYDDETTDPLGPPARDGNPASGSDVGNVTKVTIRGLDPGKRHYLKVRAYDGGSRGPLSRRATARAGATLRAWIVGVGNVRKGRRYNYVLKLKWNNGAKTNARSGVKWRLNRAGLRRAAFGRTSGKLYVKRKASLGWFRVFVKYRGKTYRKTVKVVRGSSAKGAELAAASGPVLLYRLSSRLTTFADGRDVQGRGGRLFVDPIASQYSAVVIWRDGEGDRFYQRQDWHDNDLADYTVDGPDDGSVQVVAALDRDGESLVLRRMQGLARELTLDDVTLDAVRVYRGREVALDAAGASYAAGPLLARLDGPNTRALAEAGTDFDTAVDDFLAGLAERGFEEAPAAQPRRRVAPLPPVEDLILVYRQSRRSAIVGDGARLARQQGGFLVVEPGSDLVTSISTWTDVQNTRFYSRRDWGPGADLLLDYEVDAGRRALHILAALSSKADADGLTDFGLVELRGATTDGLARTLRGRLQSGSDLGDAASPYPYIGSGSIGARLDGLRTRAATATGDHAQAVADLIQWLEDERGFVP